MYMSPVVSNMLDYCDRNNSIIVEKQTLYHFLKIINRIMAYVYVRVDKKSTPETSHINFIGIIIDSSLSCNMHCAELHALVFWDSSANYNIITY